MSKKIKEKVRIVIIGGDPVRASERIESASSRLRCAPCRDVAELSAAIARFSPQAAHVTQSDWLSPILWRRIVDLPSLRWLNLGNIGFNHVPHWDRSRLTVTNSAGAASDAMAEYVLSAVMMINAGFRTYAQDQSEKLWVRREWVPLSNKTLVAIGVGHIGSRVIAKAKRLGMRTIAVRANDHPFPGAHLTFSISQLPTALALGDYISVQVPLCEGTRALIDAKALAHVKPTAWLVNVSRGAVCVERDLIQAMRMRQIGGAVLDVFETEPLPSDSAIWALDNAIVTPHICGQIEGFNDIATDLFLKNLRRFQRGQFLQNQV